MTAPADISCEVYIGGVKIADDAASYESGAPTALAGLSLTWGRDTQVDQPATSSLTCTLAESQGGTDALDLVNVGYEIQVYAGAALASPVPTDVAQDGGFEAASLANRVQTGNETTVTKQSDTVHGGVHALRMVKNLWLAGDPPYPNMPHIPVAPYSSAATAWDLIPVVREGELWTIKIWVSQHNPIVGLETWGKLQPAIFHGPKTTDPFDLIGSPVQINRAAAGVWTHVSLDVTIPVGAATRWLGVCVWPASNLSWQAMIDTGQTVTWDTFDPNVTWAMLDALDLDDMEIYAPPSSRTTSLVFSGRITDLTLNAGARGAEVTLTASDLSADMANDNIGDQPWLAQAIKARINKIQTLSTVPFTYVYPTTYGNFVVTWVDIDSQPVLSLLTDLATSADLVLWYAFHVNKGFYLWFEDPMAREAPGALKLDTGSGLVVIDYGTNYAPQDAVLVSACDIDRDAPAFAQSVADVISRVDATWQEQTLDDKGNPAPTERYVHAMDTSLEDDYGIRRLSLSTQLTTNNDCLAVANRVIARSQLMNWTVSGVAWDTRYPKQFDDAALQYVMRLLNGVQRCGLPITLTDLPDWAPFSPDSNYYLEGGTYSYEGGFWTLELNMSPSQASGTSVAWNELDPTWRWNQFDPSIAWSDLYGVGAAGMGQTTNVVERRVN